MTRTSRSAARTSRPTLGRATARPAAGAPCAEAAPLALAALVAFALLVVWLLVPTPAHAWNSTTATITKKGLNRAVNDLADLIVGVRKASR